MRRQETKALVAAFSKSGANVIPNLISSISRLCSNDELRFRLTTSSMLTEWMRKEELHEQENSALSAIILCSSSNSTLTNDPFATAAMNGNVVFSGNIYSPKQGDDDANVVLKKIDKPDLIKAITSFLREVEGDFSVLAIQEERMLIGRDPIGVSPLYYGENNLLAAVASNRKTLWNMNIDKTRSFPPGHLGVISRNGLKTEPARVLSFNDPEAIPMQKAAETLAKLLRQSVKLRVYREKEAAVAFSGGLDSSIVASLAKQFNVKLKLIHVSLEGQTEIEEAKEAAELLDLPLQICLFKERDIEKTIPKVVDLIEEPDPVKVGVGIPFFWNAETAAKDGIKILLAGQGADELFGGYQRYVTEFLKDGSEKVNETMFQDVMSIHESNIERDEKICNFHGVDLRLPFASYEIAEFAIRLPIELKLEKETSSLRKLVLRRAAQKMGIPDEITEKPKKAVQYSTGVNNALKKLAKKQDISLKEYIQLIFEKSIKNISEEI